MSPWPLKRWTHQTGGHFSWCVVPASHRDAKRQGEPHQFPADGIGPHLPKPLRAQIPGGRQTTCPVLAATTEGMAQQSCYKRFSFLGKSYGTSLCLLQWWLWPLSTQHPPWGPAGTQGAGVTSRTCSLLGGRIWQDFTHQHTPSCWHLTEQTHTY